MKVHKHTIKYINKYEGRRASLYSGTNYSEIIATN
jgi:hypothetical protein